jgi:hypothetical protein
MSRLLLLTAFISIRAFGQTADDIINKYYEATGGKDKWSKVMSIHYTGTQTLGPGMLAPVNEVITAKPFRGFYVDFTWQGMTFKRALRADSGWIYNPFGGKRETDPMGPDDIRDAKLSADPQGLLFNYKEKGYSVEYLGTDDMDGTDVFKVRLTTKDGDMVYYYFDAENYYMLKIVTRVKLKDKEQKGYTVLSDFRKTDYGIVLPFCFQQVDENGNEQNGPTNFTKVDINTTAELAVFDKPKIVK